MKIHIKIKYLLCLLCLYGCYYLWTNLYVIEIEDKRKLIQKMTTSDRYGKPTIYYKWKLKDGSILTTSTNFEYDGDYKVGHNYIFTIQSIKLK